MPVIVRAVQKYVNKLISLDNLLFIKTYNPRCSKINSDTEKGKAVLIKRYTLY